MTFCLIEVFFKRGTYILVKTPPESDQWFQSYTIKRFSKQKKTKENAFLFLAIPHNQWCQLQTDPARSQHKIVFFLMNIHKAYYMRVFEISQIICWIFNHNYSTFINIITFTCATTSRIIVYLFIVKTHHYLSSIFYNFNRDSLLFCHNMFT